MCPQEIQRVLNRKPILFQCIPRNLCPSFWTSPKHYLLPFDTISVNITEIETWPPPSVCPLPFFLEMWVLMGFWNKGDIVDCWHRFSFSFLRCDFYNFWVFSYTNWLQVWLGLDCKYKIKNTSQWNDGVYHTGNIIGNNLSTHFHWK